MKERISGNTRAEIYGFDFRPRTDEKTNMGGEASIWLASLTGENGGETFAGIEGFVDTIIDLSQKGNICLYCFDLALHWSFIYYDLLRRGYRFVKRVRKDQEKVFSAFGSRNASTLFSAMIRPSKRSVIFFKDLKQVYAGFSSLYDMAQAFKSERPFFPDDLEKEHAKGEEPTEEERENCLSRSGFVFDVLKRQEGDPAFFQAFTLASYSMKRAILRAFGWCKAPYAVFRSKKMYPRTKDPDEITALRCSIKGGLTGPTIAAIDRGYEIHDEIFVIDRTQSYPTEMRYSKMPRGLGEPFEGFQIIKKSCCLYHVLIKSFDAVKIHSIPALMQGHIHFMPEGSDPIELWLWEWEYWAAFSCYINLKAEVLGGYAYKLGVCPFGQYVEENQAQRAKLEDEGDHIQAAHLKALNVSIYGKLIQKNSKETFTLETDEEGVMTTGLSERDEEKEAAYIYLPAGSAIPSLARYHLIELAQKFGYENVLYVETDSLIVLANDKTKAVLNDMDLCKELGHWHLEAFAKRAYFPMAKRYKYETLDGRVVVKGAGIGVDAFKGLSFDEAKITGSKVEQRVKKRAKGGTLLIKMQKKLKEIKQ